MYNANPFAAIDWTSERNEMRDNEIDNELTDILGDWRTAEKESANPERYVSESDYFASPDTMSDDIASFDGIYIDPAELDDAFYVATELVFGAKVLWCESCQTFTAHTPPVWGMLPDCLACTS